ncbi:MAG: NAD-dependent DNA ligase LigA, partial [Clostridiales Family XIII bacterium]|nr:NAD-dependent DNA ligase LigA [Clostridiales Family XIII bacterium]
MDGKIKRMRELMQTLDAAARAYYAEDREVMPNREYDALYDELAALEGETGLILSGSPTQRLGYAVSERLEKKAHRHPMLSLDKTKSPAELAGFLGDKDGILSWKLDGLTIALEYRDGVLAEAVTRGDGTTGEVVTENARAFENVPLKIAFPGTLLIRGEAVIRYSDFEKVNAAIEDEAAKYKNPRNLCSGSVRQLNSAVTAERHVRFYAFSLVEAAEGLLPVDFSDSREAQLKWLAREGFGTVGYRRVDRGNVEEAVAAFAREVETSDLPSDGLVLLFDSISYGQSLGRTAKFPRDAIAFKWEDELAATTLTGVEWSTSRTGLINPVALFAPIEIEGTTVKRASLHNLSIIEELALGVGDEILVYKANMIIPQIAENRTKSGGLPVPATCPACGSPTEVRASGDVKSLYCTNPDCAARKIRALGHFVSRQALNIEGLSEQTLEKLLGVGIIKSYADIFRLAREKERIVALDGFGEKSYENLLAAVDAARTVSVARLLAGIGIPGIGAANAKVICRHFRFDWEKIAGATAAELLEIDGIGDVLAENYVAWFADAENKAQLAEILSQITFDPAEQTAAQAGNGLAGLTFV